MIDVGGLGIYFDGGHKGTFEIYIVRRPGVIRNRYSDNVLKIEGRDVDCSGDIFRALLKYVDFYTPEGGKKILKDHEWLIKECFKEQLKGEKHDESVKCYECGVDGAPCEDRCLAEWDKPYYCSIFSTSLCSNKFIDLTNSPLINLKDLDLRSKYISGIHMICKIKSLKKPVVEAGFYKQTCVFYDDNTSKTVNAILKDGIADFDKWHIGDKVELIGTFTHGKLNVTSMELLEVDSSEPTVFNRNDETPGYYEWRKTIINRDHNCVCCGYDKHLEAHHLFGYKENPSLAVNESNGVVLCKFCHDKYHNIYGIKNINPVDFINFIKRFGVSK